LWSIFWVLVLLFVGWMVSGFCAWVWVFVAPFSACCQIDGFMEILQKGMNWVKDIGQNIKNGKSLGK